MYIEFWMAAQSMVYFMSFSNDMVVFMGLLHSIGRHHPIRRVMVRVCFEIKRELWTCTRGTILWCVCSVYAWTRNHVWNAIKCAERANGVNWWPNVLMERFVCVQLMNLYVCIYLRFNHTEFIMDVEFREIIN